MTLFCFDTPLEVQFDFLFALCLSSIPILFAQLFFTARSALAKILTTSTAIDKFTLVATTAWPFTIAANQVVSEPTLQSQLLPSLVC